MQFDLKYHRVNRSKIDIEIDKTYNSKGTGEIIMAIFRCNKCGHIREVGCEYVSKSVKCPKCEHPSTIHDTVAFLQALIKKHITISKELYQQRQESTIDNSTRETIENISLEDIDIHNTNKPCF